MNMGIFGGAFSTHTADLEDVTSEVTDKVQRDMGCLLVVARAGTGL